MQDHVSTTTAGITSAGASLRIGSVALTVRDLDRVSRFYRDAIGLAPISTDGNVHQLGAGGRVLVELRHDPDAAIADRRQAGLFHTAFLLPRREDLADWLVHATVTGVRLDGASDHLVSEALYLTDPEGNGIEIYHDRPSEAWPREADGRIGMATLRIDLDDLAAAAGPGPFAGMPDGTIVGHVHLQVGDLDAAEDFVAGTLGMPVTSTYRGAVFFGADGYHHHLGANIWNSRGAGPRAEGTTGLAGIRLLAAPAAFRRLEARLSRNGDGLLEARDPWGTRLVFEEK